MAYKFQRLGEKKYKVSLFPTLSGDPQLLWFVFSQTKIPKTVKGEVQSIVGKQFSNDLTFGNTKLLKCAKHVYLLSRPWNIIIHSYFFWLQKRNKVAHFIDSIFCYIYWGLVLTNLMSRPAWDCYKFKVHIIISKLKTKMCEATMVASYSFRRKEKLTSLKRTHYIAEQWKLSNCMHKWLNCNK